MAYRPLQGRIHSQGEAGAVRVVRAARLQAAQDEDGQAAEGGEVSDREDQIVDEFEHLEACGNKDANLRATIILCTAY